MSYFTICVWFRNLQCRVKLGISLCYKTFHSLYVSGRYYND